MTDQSTMPWGKYAGKQMADVPADYLIWLFENGKCHNDVKRYIEENMDVLKAQAERERAKKGSRV